MSGHKKILAIDPGTRHMGTAFFEDEELTYHGVISIKDEMPHDKLSEGRKAILRLIRSLKPNALVVEKTFSANNRTASLLNVFVDEIRAIGKSKKIRSYAPKTVRKFICGDGRADKKAAR